jgi:hypothetical protein
MRARDQDREACETAAVELQVLDIAVADEAVETMI